MKRLITATAVLAAAIAGSISAAPPAAAQPLVTGGLVNITITEVIDDVTVIVRDVNVSLGAALGIAANVCDVNVLAQQLGNDTVTCTSEASGQTVTISQV